MFKATTLPTAVLAAALARLGVNKRLHEYAVALKDFAEEQRAPFADQFHRLLDVWGKNKPAEDLSRALSTLKVAASDDNLAGVEHLRAFLAEQARSPRP